MLLKSIAVLSLSFSSIAFAQTSIQQRLLDTTRRVTDIVYRDVNYIDAERARAATAKLQEAEQILLGYGGGGGTRPDPYPGNPSYPGTPSLPAQHISGRIGSISFTASARTTNEVYQACASAAANQARADVVEVSVNYGQTMKSTTPSWWVGAGAGCVQLTQLLIASGFPSDSSQLYYAGSIGGHTFSFAGRDIADVGIQCESFVRSKGISRVDNIVATNFRVSRTLTTPGWWTTSFEMCQQVLNLR